MGKIIKVLDNRDFVLSLSVVVGLIVGESVKFLADISIYTLMLAMVASTINFSFSTWKNPSNLLKPLVGSFLLTYVLFAFFTITLAWLFFYRTGQESLWVGFVIVAAAPPGPAVVPFSSMLNGDNNFSTTGLFGMYILAMVVTPLILFSFVGTTLINPGMIFFIMLQLIIIPLIISRFLRHPKVLPHAQKVSGTLIKWLFFLVIMPIIGMNRSVFFENPSIFLTVALILFVSMFVLAFIYNLIMVKVLPEKSLIISSSFMLTIKSAAFSAVVAFRFFGEEPVVAVPAAVLSIFIILFAIFYSLFVNKRLDKMLKK